MTERIEVGDMVMVVRWPHKCSEPTGHAGMIGIVTKLRDYTFCKKCSSARWEEPCASFGHGFIPTAWMKKINPPTALERHSATKEITA